MVFWRRRSTDGRTRKSCDGLDAAAGAPSCQPWHYKACTPDPLLRSGIGAPQNG
jgi:hypothetical protein